MDAVARTLPRDFSGLVVTPALTVALHVMERGLRVQVVGGTLCPAGAMATGGAAERAIAAVAADVCLLGACGLWSDFGLSAEDPAEAGVKLIAVDQSASGDLNGTTIARTVTVAADPQQVAALAQAQSTGRLSLSLVGSGDDIIAEAVEIDQDRLLGIVRETKTEEVKKEEEKVCTIRTRRGADVVDIPIPCTN